MKLTIATLALFASSAQAGKLFRGMGRKNGGGGGGNTQAATSLDDDEKRDLLFMREEEKMARDVYLTLYEKWNDAAFARIAASEQNHMDRTGEMIDLYGLEDPVQAGRGVFTNKGLEDMYRDLVADGEISLDRAYMVGGLIEETDISDLENAIVATDEPRLARIYGNLKRASENHLRQFVTLYEASYGPYDAQVLDPAEVDAIVN